MSYRRTAFAALALALVLVSLPLTATAFLETGRYQSRPGGALLRCGGTGGTCAVSSLEGSLVLDVTGATPPGVLADFVITAADLRIGTPTFGEPMPPLPGELPLVGLVGEVDVDRIVFTSPPGSPEDVELTMYPIAYGFVLHGSFTEDGGIPNEILAVTFDWTGGETQPAMILDGEPSEPGRFEVRVDWERPQGGTGTGTPVKLDALSGSFWFFRPDNPELFLKIVPACEAPFDRVWVFVSGLTHVGVTIHVRDTHHFARPEKTYTSPVGVEFEPIFDTVGFECLGSP